MTGPAVIQYVGTQMLPDSYIVKILTCNFPQHIYSYASIIQGSLLTIILLNYHLIVVNTM